MEQLRPDPIRHTQISTSLTESCIRFLKLAASPIPPRLTSITSMRQQKLTTNQHQLTSLGPLRLGAAQPTKSNTMIPNPLPLNLIANPRALHKTAIRQLDRRAMRMLDELTQTFQEGDHSAVEFGVKQPAEGGYGIAVVEEFEGVGAGFWGVRGVVGSVIAVAAAATASTASATGSLVLLDAAGGAHGDEFVALECEIEFLCHSDEE